ncbi:hypothetical protein [Deinococcus sp.]|uniref:hypothetical protein n=1 Tax=Deinococcus sp. TaxID=47478 RepID=UPI003C7AB2B7
MNKPSGLPDDLTPAQQAASPGNAESGAAGALLDLGLRSREQQRKLAEARAREHVGAAGWQQTTLLEEIIRAGRDQFATTDALRQVISLTTETLRSLPLAAGQESRDDQQRTLEQIVASGNQQVQAAYELEEVIRQALGEIVETPLPDVNARQLERILLRVQQQITALNLMIEAARVQVSTLEQLQAIDDVSASYQQRLGELQSLSAEEELEVLGNVGVQVVGRIAELDAAGDRQLEKLGSIGAAAVRQVSETGASRDEQLHTLHSIQAEAEVQAERLRTAE